MTAPAVVDTDPAIVEAQAAVDAAEATRVADEAAQVARDAQGRFAAKPADEVVTPAEVVDPAKPVADAPVVPEKYDLKLPADSTLDASITERTAAIARELGLSNDKAQTLLDETVKDLTARDMASVEANKPGGAAWTARTEQWAKDALANPTIGGSPDQLAVSVEKAKQAMGKYASPEVSTFLEETGFGSHPAVIALFANIGKAMSEGALVLGVSPSTGPKLAGGLYLNEGRGPIAENAAQ